MIESEVIIEIQKIKRYAEENNIPIMQDEGIDFLVSYIAKKNIKNILEIGTAIGYSAIKMALVSSDIHVTTLALYLLSPAIISYLSPSFLTIIG